MDPQSATPLTVAALHYQMAANVGQAFSSLTRLREFAAPLAETSVISRLRGKDLLPTGEDDPLLSLKQSARREYNVDGKAVAVLPERLVGFIVKFANEQEMPIGLAKYPEVIRTADGKFYELPDAEKMHFSGQVQTFCDHPLCGSPIYVNSRAHELAVSVLDEAKKIGILSEVIDPTGHWDDRDGEVLRAICDGITKGSIIVAA
jgi:hypothetical protein